MYKNRLGRLTLMLVGLCGLLALIASSAAAAGKPSIRTVGVYNYTDAITHTKIDPEVNPNGAATTAKIEYRENNVSGVWKTFQTKELGAGTKGVSFLTETLNGLKPQQAYQFRVTATNSYGTAELTEGWEMEWLLVEKGRNNPATFATSGTFELNYTIGGEPLKLACSESGYGSLGHRESVGDSYHLTASNCVYYHRNEVICKANPVSFTMDGTFKVTSGILNLRFCPGEEVERGLSFTEPFYVTTPVETVWVKMPWTLTTPVHVGGNAGTITISTEAQLTGENVGKKFAVYTE